MIHASSPRTGRRIVQLAVASLVWSATSPALSLEPAQSPMLNRAPATVPPNVFFTFDDSGSMGWSFIPDELGEVVLNVTNLSSANFYPIVHPGDVLPLPNGRPGCLVPQYGAASDYTKATVVGTSGATARNKAFAGFRSSVKNPLHHNSLYYNPNIRYRPWMKPDGTEFPAVTNVRAVPVDPWSIVKANSGSAFTPSVRTTATIDLTPAKNAKGLLTATPNSADSDYRWCDNTSDTAQRIFSPAAYFTYDAATGGYTLVDISGAASTAMFPPDGNKGADRTDCANATKCTRAEELLNFANWFTYYRTRNLLAIGSASRAFGPQRGKIRLGYGRINNTSTVEGAPGTVIRGVRDFTLGTTPRNDFFYKFLYSAPYSGGTPLRRAMDDVGRYFMVEHDNGPWSNTPGTGSSSTRTDQLACRKSYHILMTDGYWNGVDANTADATKDVDSLVGPEITGPNGRKYKYDPAVAKIYRDGWGNTLADVAQYYWQNDLHKNLDNRVPPTSNSDPATDRGDHGFWQHLTTYTIGLGVQGTVTNTENPPPNPADVNNGWPRPPGSGGSASSNVSSGSETSAMVDDLWHASVNGRGDYVSAQNSAEFEGALNSFLSAINEAAETASGVTVSSFVLSESSKKFVPSYKPGVWTGDLVASKTNSNGDTLSQAWSANQKLPEASARKILTWNGTAAEEFGTSMSSSLRSATLWGLSTPPADTLINFIRGDRSLEGTTYRCRGGREGDDCAKIIAAKTGRIGDIVNSNPVLVQGNLNMYYEFLPPGIPGQGQYGAFRKDKVARETGVVFVGANDGMLHGFNSSTGVEVMAFVPQAVYGNLARLADPDYGSITDSTKSHRFYVDGPLVESDGYVSGAWTNLLLGSTGGGGKSVFAIKVNTTTPTTFEPANVLWELNANGTFADKTKLGHVMSPLQVGPMPNGQWVAIFGNGPNSAAGTANLFIVDLATGAPIKVIQAGTATGNGLGGVTLLRNSNRVIVGAYAGDLKGNLWRFDLESKESSAWKVGMGGLPLFSAGATQPITAAPAFLAHPLGGVMVIAGTGRLLYEDDPSTTAVNEDDLVNTAMQTVYGIWDTTKIGEASVATTAVSGTSKLIQQTFTKLPNPAGVEGDYWQLSDNAVAWTDSAGIRGWYANMNLASGQRNVFPPQIYSEVAYLPTIAPTGSTNACDPASASTYHLLFNPLTGGRLRTRTLDLGDPAIIVAAFKSSFRGEPKLTIRADGKGNILSGEDSEGPVSFSPRFVQRNWNQIMNFPRAR